MDHEARAQREDLPAGYTHQTIAWIIQLDSHGHLEDVIPMAAGRARRPQGLRLAVPYLRRTGPNIKPQLLADTAEFVLGLSAGDPERAATRHRAFVAFVQACADATGEETVRAVATFLARSEVGHLPAAHAIAPAQKMTFRVDTLFPVSLPSVRTFWARLIPHLGERGLGALSVDLLQALLRSPPDAMEDPQRWHCLVCGRPCTPTRIHPIAITLPRGVANQPGALVTAAEDNTAFHSYGLTEAFSAPTCRPCAERYAKTLNRLIAHPDTHLTIGPLVYLIWTPAQQACSLASLLAHPQPEAVRALMASVGRGRGADSASDPTPLYTTALSASGSRVVVRAWGETTVERATQHLARWFQWQAIIGEWGELDAPPVPIRGFLDQEGPTWVEGLAESIVPSIQGRRDVTQIPPNVPQMLLHLALHGGRGLRWLLFLTVQRTQGEHQVTRPRAALLKLILLSQRPCTTVFTPDAVPRGSASGRKADTMVQLDPINQDPAYRCGRLLALVEIIQRAAVPGIHATLTERYFAAASTAPASVFGQLLRGAQAHLHTLRTERRGTCEALERKLTEVQAGLTAFPHTLTLDQQGVFCLGYYHQRAAERAAARA
jgi:CRISPR-associated protein Csd1